MDDIRTIKVIVKHCEVKTGKDAGRKFDAYRAVQKDGKLMDCHFRRTVSNIPAENFIMRVDASKMNVSRKYQYPRLWVTEVIEFVPVDYNATEANEDLPF